MLPNRVTALFSSSFVALVATASLVGCSRHPTYIDGDGKGTRTGVVKEASVADAAAQDKPASPTSKLDTPKAPAHKAAAPTWVGVAASRAKNVVAAWSKTEVVMSSDGGATFHSVLGGPGSVDKVTVDARGRVYAVRHGKQIGIRSAEGLTKWRAIPGATKTEILTTGAGAVAWVGTRKVDGGDVVSLAISRDDGDTWTFPEMPSPGNAGNQVVIEDDGTIRVMVGSEADCGGGFQHRFVGKLGQTEWKEVDWPFDMAGNWGVGAGGWAYGVGECGEGKPPGHLCGASPTGDAVPIAPVQDKEFKRVSVVTDGKVAWGVVDDKLASFTAGSVIFPAVGTPRGFAVTAIDAEGMPIGLARGKAMRWTRAGKWQPLFQAPDKNA